MEKKILSAVAKTVVTVAVLALAAACADGGHGAGPAALGPSISKPTITKFVISKVGGTGAPGSSVTIGEGDSVLLEWEVMMAAPEAEEGPATGVTPKDDEGSGEDEANPATDVPMITLDCEALKLHKENLSPVGSQKIDSIKVDAVFVLTAKMGTESDSRKVSAVVGAAGPAMEVSFTANPEQISEGESAELCWDISQPNVAFTIVDSDNNTIVATTLPGETVSESKEDMVEGDEIISAAKAVLFRTKDVASSDGDDEETPYYGISDCVTVTPAKTTTYYLTVTAPGVEGVEKSATVKVERGIKIEYFKASPEKIAGETEVTLSWKVEPAEATVTISGVKGVFEAVDSTIVTVSETTTFTLTAALGEWTKEEVVKVTYEPRGGVTLKLSVDKPSVFVGEAFNLKWEVTTDAPEDVAVLIRGGEYGEAGVEKSGSSGAIEIVPSAGGEITYVAEIVADYAREGVIDMVSVVVREWSAPAGSSLASATFDPEGANRVYAGYAQGMQDGKVRLARHSPTEAWTDVYINYVELFNSFDGMPWKESLFGDFGDYPVNNIALDSASNGQRIYVGTSGALFLSKDGGANWIIVEAIGDFSKDGTHPSCKGRVQPGRKANFDGDFVGLRQVCDIVVTSSSRVVVAYDEGVAYNDHVDKHIEERSNESYAWQGVRRNGEGGNVLSDHIVSDLVDTGAAIYAAADNGVWMSSDDAETWSDVGSLGLFANSVEVDGTNVYAGAKEGIYLYRDGTWKKQTSFSEGVLSLKRDPAEKGVIYAGTDNGLYVSRDDGKTWTRVLTGAEEGIAVNDIVTGAIIGKDRSKVGIYAATSNGLYSSVETVYTKNAQQGGGQNDEGDKNPDLPEQNPNIGGGKAMSATGTMSTILPGQ